MANPGRRHQIKHAVEQPVAGPQDRDETQFLATELGRLKGLERRLDINHIEGQIAGDFITKQQTDFPQQRPELHRRGGLIPHEREFMLNQGMIDDRRVRHDIISFKKPRHPV